MIGGFDAIRPATASQATEFAVFSSGMKGVLFDALGWAATAGALALAITHFDDIRAFNRSVLGIELPENDGKLVAATAQQAATSQQTSRGASGAVEISAGDNGHFHSDVEINGRYVPLMVDTGASLVVLTYDDASRAGIFVSDSDFTAKSQTANGIARNAIVTLDRVCIESVCVRDVKAMVAERGRLHVSLLGMSFLGRLRRMDMQSGRLVLEN